MFIKVLLVVATVPFFRILFISRSTSVLKNMENNFLSSENMRTVDLFYDKSELETYMKAYEIKNPSTSLCSFYYGTT